jgi:hypothetical protein
LNQKLGNITLADIVKLEWPNPPDEPSCPLDTLEEMTRKALDEREDMKGKLIVQDKAMAQLKLQQQKAVDDLALVEEQTLKLRKVIKNRNEMIENTLINKEMALPPSETLPKLNEVDKKVDSSNLKREEKLEQKPEKLVGSGEMDFEQKGHSYVSFSTLSVNPATGVPLLQHSTPVYGCQPLLCSSPYFCKYYVCAHVLAYVCLHACAYFCVCVCVCVCARAHYYHPLCYVQVVHVKVTSTSQIVLITCAQDW